MALSVLGLIVRRDLKLAYRRWSEWGNPLLFFVVVSSMFPLAIDIQASAGSDASLQTLGIGILWVAALLSSLLSLDRLFLSDIDDGTMEQLVLSPVPFVVIIYGKLAAHWIVSGLPLIVLVPFVGLSYELPIDASVTLALALALATPTLTVLVAIGAALTVNLRSAAAIIGLMILPLCSPILIFGTRATELALYAEPTAGPLYLLASVAVLALSLGPIAITAALRVGLE